MRRARPGDALWASRLECEDLRIRWTPYAHWIWLLAIRYWRVLVATDARGRRIGAASCAPTVGGPTYFQLLIVDPARRRAGVGSRLLREMLRRIGPGERVVGLVHSRNAASMATIVRHGFRRGRPAGNFFRDGRRWHEWARPAVRSKD